MMKKITFDLYIISPTKINSRWMKDLNVSYKKMLKKILVKIKEITYISKARGNFINQDRETRNYCQN